MPIPVHAHDYRLAAGERIHAARRLHEDLQEYPMAMYLAGLAAECMLRAYTRTDAAFDSHHDLTNLLRLCDSERLGVMARERMRGPLQSVHMLWQNRYRYFGEGRLRAHLRSLKLDQGKGIHRGADFLKVRSDQLLDACIEIVSIGEQRWPTN